MYDPTRPLVIDPWVAPTGRLESNLHVSRHSAGRHSVLAALRERRDASRPNRPTPWPARVEPTNRPQSGPSPSARTAAPVEREFSSIG
jgi:hypothetical protein